MDERPEPQAGTAAETATDPDVDPDVTTDPARDDEVGVDWTTEGGATPSGPATDTGAGTGEED